MDWIVLDKVNNDWISVTIFSNLILLSFTKWRYDRKFTSFFKSIDPSVYFNNYGNNFFFNRFFGFSILIFSLISVSLFLILVLNSFDLVKLNFFKFLILFSFLLLNGLLSYLLTLFLGDILSVKKEALVYIFNNLRFLFRVSVLIFISLFIHHFYFLSSFFFLKTTFICAIIFYFFSNIVNFNRFIGEINTRKFYFILYLCTLKITPWVFIYWYINNI